MAVGTASARFQTVHAAMERYVEEGTLAGVSIAVLHGRELADMHCTGWADREAGTLLGVDHIFRVFSNTKLVTSCAALLLFEEGRFALDDPVERFIPELADRRVLLSDACSIDEVRPAFGPITIRHLMCHTSGLSYGLSDDGRIISRAYIERKVLNPDQTLAEMMGVLAGLPLAFEPGTSWEYSVATDVLARLVEVVSGQPFDTFVQARIFDPLGMADTGFTVPDRERLVAFYDSPDPLDPGMLVRMEDAPYPTAFGRPNRWLNGGGGLVSTLLDTAALIRSLRPGGPTLLKPETIRLMMTNQLPEGVCIGFAETGALAGRGHGLAGAVVVEPAEGEDVVSRGELYWGGMAGTQWWISPACDAAGIVMAQRHLSFAHPFAAELKRLVYAALSDR